MISLNNFLLLINRLSFKFYFNCCLPDYLRTCAPFDFKYELSKSQIFRIYILKGLFFGGISPPSFSYFFTKSKGFNLIDWSCINISYESLRNLYGMGVKKEENF